MRSGLRSALTTLEIFLRFYNCEDCFQVPFLLPLLGMAKTLKQKMAEQNQKVRKDQREKNKAVQEERKKAKAAEKEKKANAVAQEEKEEDKGKYDSRSVQVKLKFVSV